MADETIVRRATRADVGDVVVLTNIATHGLFADIWSRERTSGTIYNPLEVGRLKVLGEGELSWRHANLAVRDGETVGLMLGFPEPERTSGSVGNDSYTELASLTGGGWHISKVAVHAHWRGHGVAGRLLAAAEERRAEAGESRLFLIVPDSFSAALQLYRKHGFREWERRTMVLPTGALDLGARDWVLLVKE